MAGRKETIRVDLEFNANTERAKRQMADLQHKLNSIAAMSTRNSKVDAFTKDIEKSSIAATKLQANLTQAFNVDTGKLNLNKFNQEMQRSKMSVQQYKEALVSAGPIGEQAFKLLAKSVATAETPLLRLSDGVKKLGTTLSNTVRWQISASVIQGFMSALSTAYGFAQDLNKSLNDIRIVTEYNVETMDKFAEKANKMAKALRTTTNEYAKASLIYFQQGLSMKEVEERTNATIKLAQVTGKSVEQVSNQLTAVWNNFDNGTKSLEYYVDVITALGAATASSSEEITQGLEKFAAIAETVGLSYEYATAALATVTSETRQSADIVGTAFKTLFARIQDLELGKTLEDGVTLGQYSAAMESIGVSVLDATGNVKDMNEILNEMGKRWDKISKAQQISLAQNVAGVRQYTQLIALMDNWDEFQQNVQIAESSEGSLSRQQEIWAESWEAANEKVRASLETIYQLLLDDDAFISILNFTSDSVDAIGSLVKGMGGLSTILPLVSSLLLKTFSADIADGIDNITFSVRSLTKAGRAENERLKEEMALQLKQNVPEKGIEAFTGEAGVSQALMQQEYNRLMISEKLNKTQKLQAEMYLNQNLALTEQVELLAQKAREAQKAYNIEKLDLDKSQKDLLQQRTQALFTSQIMTDIGPEYNEVVGQAFGDDAKINQMIPAIEELEEHVRTMGISAEEVAPRLKKLFGEQGTENVKGYAAAIQKAKEAVENYQKINTPENELKVKQALEGVKTAYGNVEEAIGTVLTATKDLPKEAKEAATRLAGANAEVVKSTATATGASERFAEGLKKVIDKQKSSTQGLIEVASGITSLVFAFNSFKSAWDALNNEDLTWGEKLISVFSALTMAIPMAVKGFKALNLENLKNVGTNLLNILSLGKLKKAIKEKTAAEEADKKNGSGDTPEGIATTKAQAEATKEVTQATKEKIAVEEIDKANDPSSTLMNKNGHKVGDVFSLGKGANNEYELKHDGSSFYYENNKKNRVKADKFKGLKPISKKPTPLKTEVPKDVSSKAIEEVAKEGAPGLASSVGSSGALAGLGPALATAGVIAAIIAAIAVTVISLKKGFEQVEKEAQTAEEHAKNLKQAFTDTKQQFDDLMSTSSSHEEALKALDEMQKGTVKYTQALNDANAQALELINAYEELEYHWENGAIVFDNMEEVLEKESAKVAEALGRSELARASAIDKRSRADMVNFARNTLGDTWAGYDSNFLGIGLGNSNQSESEKVLQKLADMYNERGEVIFENFAATLRGAELGIDDYGLIYALEENAKAVMDLTKQIARDDTSEENAWKNAYIQKNNLGDNPNAEAIASQAWKDLSDKNGTGANAASATEQKIKNQSKADNAKWYLISVLGEKEEDIVKVGSGWGSGWMGKNYYIKDTGGAGVTIKYRPDESSEWVDLYGEKNAFAHTDLNKQLIESEVMKALSEENNISSYSGNISATKKELRAAGFASDDRLDDVINEFYDTGTVNLTDYSGTEVEALKANLDRVSDAVVRQALEEAISGYWDAIRGANINKTQSAKEALGETNANELLALLQQYEMSQEAFEEYVKQFEEYGTAAEDVAKHILEVGSQQKKLGEIYSKSAGEILIGVNAIKQGQDASPKAVAAIKDIQNTFKEWFGADLDFDYLVENFELVQQVIEGDAEALKDLRHQAALNLVDDLNVQHKAVKDFLKSFIEVSAGAEHFEGEILSNSKVLMDFNKLLEQGQIESGELRDILANEGWQLDIEINPTTGKESVKQLVYVGYQGLDDTALEKESERYHYIRETLSDLESYYNRIDKAKSRAFGANRLALLDQERNAIQSLIDAQSRYLDQIKDNIPNDANALRRYGAEFDNYGRVKNADALLAQFEDDSNFKNILSQYEETLNLLESEREKYEDLINQSLDVKLEKIQYTVDLKVSIAEDELTTLDYYLDKLSDSVDDVVKSVELLSKKIPLLQDQIEAQKSGVQSLFKEAGFSDQAIGKLLSGEELSDSDYKSTKTGENITITNEMAEALRSFKDSIISMSSAAEEAYEQIGESISNAIDKINEDMSKNINRIKNIGSIANSVRDVVDLLGVQLPGASAIVKSLSEASVASAKGSVEAAKTILDTNRALREEAEKGLQSAIEREDTKAIEEWNEQIESLDEKIRESEEEWVSTIQSSLSAVVDTYKRAMEDAQKEFEKAMSGTAGFFEQLTNSFDRVKEQSDWYLSNYEKIYQFSKLNRDIAKSIDETDSVKAQQSLRDLQEEINALQEDGREVSQYELDNLRAKYELRVAEIALEEAQNAKSQVRMQRDASGNWGYVYTADQDNIDKAQQNVEDKLYNIQKLQQDYALETQEMLVELPQKYSEAIAAIYADASLTDEQRQKAIDEVSAHYNSAMQYWSGELNKALTDAKYLYENDWTDYSKYTGYKILDNADWVDDFEDTIIAQTGGYESLQDIQTQFGDSSTALIDSLNEAYQSYQTNVNEVMEAAGASIEETTNEAGDKITQFGETFEAMAKVAKEAIGSKKDKTGLLGKMAEIEESSAFSQLVSQADAFYDSYQKTIGKFIGENDKFIASIDKVLAKYKELLTTAGVEAPEVTIPKTDDIKTSSSGEIKTMTGYGAKNLSPHAAEKISYSKIISSKETKKGSGVWYTIYEDAEGNQYDTFTDFDATNYQGDSTKTSSTSYNGVERYDDRDYKDHQDEKAEEERKEKIRNGSYVINTFYGADGQPYYQMSGLQYKLVRGDALEKAYLGYNGNYSVYDKDELIKNAPKQIELKGLVGGETVIKDYYYTPDASNAAGYISEEQLAKNAKIDNDVRFGKLLIHFDKYKAAVPSAWMSINDLQLFDTGGYTGSWDSSGRLAMLHQKEIVLNARDTENFLAAVDIVRDIASMIDLQAAAQRSTLSMISSTSVVPATQTLQQEVTIHAEFPNATQRTEIEAAFDTLLNRASQFANRKN